MQERLRQLQEHHDSKKYYNKLNYHLKKVQPFRNRTKNTVAQQMKPYKRQQKVSIIPNTTTFANKRYINKNPQKQQQRIKQKIVDQQKQDLINEEHINQNLIHVHSQIKIYQAPGSARKNPFQRGSSDLKNKKIDVLQRGKSLKFWKVQKSEPKLFTQIKGFFNTFLSENDGCECGPSCEITQAFLKWINVPEQLMRMNYARLLNEAYKKQQKHHRRLGYSQTSYPSENQSQQEKRQQTNRYSTFSNFYEDSCYSKGELEKHLIQIRKDVIRTQTQCQLFHRKQTHEKLERILLCYTVEDPEVGYVQSMNIVVSGILYHVRDEAKTYAISRKLIHQIRCIYLNDFKQCYKHIDNIIQELKLQVLDLYTHLEEINIQLKVILFPWILSLLCVIIPLQHLHIIYLGFIKEGWLFIYKSVIAMFVYHKETLLQMEQAGDVLVFLSASNQQQKQMSQWEDILHFGQALSITHNSITQRKRPVTGHGRG